MSDDTESQLEKTETSIGGLKAVAKAVGTLLGLHVEYAQREVSGDLGRIGKGVGLLVGGGLLAAIALTFFHVGAWCALRDLTRLTAWGSALVVGGVDLLFGLILILAGKGNLKKPMLKETRSLVRKTLNSFAELK